VWVTNPVGLIDLSIAIIVQRIAALRSCLEIVSALGRPSHACGATDPANTNSSFAARIARIGTKDFTAANRKAPNPGFANVAVRAENLMDLVRTRARDLDPVRRVAGVESRLRRGRRKCACPADASAGARTNLPDHGKTHASSGALTIHDSRSEAVLATALIARVPLATIEPKLNVEVSVARTRGRRCRREDELEIHDFVLLAVEIPHFVPGHDHSASRRIDVPPHAVPIRVMARRIGHSELTVGVFAVGRIEPDVRVGPEGRDHRLIRDREGLRCVRTEGRTETDVPVGVDEHRSMRLVEESKTRGKHRRNIDRT
jgi:hypothetical protein